MYDSFTTFSFLLSCIYLEKFAIKLEGTKKMLLECPKSNATKNQFMSLIRNLDGGIEHDNFLRFNPHN